VIVVLVVLLLEGRHGVVVTVLVWTNEVHGLIWTETMPIPFGDILVMSYSYGPAFWGNTVYSYGLVLVGLWLLVRQFLQISAWHRRRVGAVIVGGALPWLGNLLFNVGVQPTPPLNITHLGFALSGGIFLWAFYHQQLLNPTQRFRERVFESADTGMVLLNTDREIVDLNPAAEAVLGVERSRAVGHALDSILPPESAVFRREGERIYNDEITLPGEDGDRQYDVEISSMYYPQQQRVMGQVVTFHGPR
jgi:PAS domain S-box-containing protein